MQYVQSVTNTPKLQILQVEWGEARGGDAAIGVSAASKTKSKSSDDDAIRMYKS